MCYWKSPNRHDERKNLHDITRSYVTSTTDSRMYANIMCSGEIEICFTLSDDENGGFSNSIDDKARAYNTDILKSIM